MCAVYKRGDKGVFYMNFTVNGKRVFRSTGKYSKKEARQVEAIERQKLLDQEKMTPNERAAKTLLSEAIKQVYNARWKNNKDGEFSHRRALKVLELLGDMPVGSIDQDKVEHLTHVLDVNRAPGTINRYLAVLKTVLRHKRQQWDHVKLRKERKGRIRVISKEEERKIGDLLRDWPKKTVRTEHFPEVADLVEVLVDTGMRLGELLALKYEDINSETNLISIWFNKGDRPRSIPMTKRVKHILESRKATDKLKPFSINTYQSENAWKSVRKQMGLQGDKEFVLHALRHTCATRLVNRGVDLYVVKEWLGHSTIQVTEKYAHLSPGKLADAVAVLES